MMNKRAVRTGLSMLALALSALAAVAQLNPTVKVLSRPNSPVPAECIEGTAPQAQPRVDVAQIPEAPKQKAMKAPPSASLRGLLEETQLAAGRGDRIAFRDALARAKAALENFPTGGERNIATEVIGTYDDVDRIWSYQFDTPSGAFFEAGTVPAEIMKKYPGYEKAIAGQVFADSSGHRFYPTVETREYLLREAAQRLNRLGISATAPAVREARVAPRAAAPAVKTTQATPGATEKPATHRDVTTTHPKPAVKAAAKTSKPSTHHVPRSTTQSPVSTTVAKPAATEKRSEKTAVAPTSPAVKSEAPKSATTETAKQGSMSTTHAQAKSEPPVKVAETPMSAALPVAASHTPAAAPLIPATTTAPSSVPATSTTTAPAPAVPTIATDTATTASITHPIATDNTESAASTDTTDSTGTAAKPGKQGKSVILPIILIVIGIGVLIVLFRASS